jgi:hypothetical protein
MVRSSFPKMAIARAQLERGELPWKSVSKNLTEEMVHCFSPPQF